jgi:hypothetical protein
MKKQDSGRRPHSLGETYIIMYRAIRTIPHLLRAEKDGAMSEALKSD